MPRVQHEQEGPLTDPLRELALKILWLNWGKPYRWGGDDPSSFDCSGLVIEVLQSVGLFPRGQDATADGLRKIYRMSVVANHADAQPGDLVLFMSADGDRAIHVETVVANVNLEPEDPDGLHELYSLGASGGGSRTNTTEDAWAQNAYVKMRPVASTHPRRGRVIIDPYAPPVEDVT